MTGICAKITKRISAAAAMLAVCLCMLCGCAPKYREYTSFAMGSMVSAKIYAQSTEADAIFASMTDGISALDSHISATDPDSDIYRLNSGASESIDPMTADFTEKALEVCKRCGGTVDITMGAATELWGFSSGEPSLPDDAALQTALSSKGLDSVKIDKTAGKISLKAGQKLDLGAVGKGAACDKAYEALASHDCSAVVTVGGSVLLYGKAPDGSWTVGIRDPFKTANDYFAVLRFSSVNADTPVFLSTSGNYEKTFEEDGKKYHHILDPETGFPVENGLAAVTVKAGTGLEADALSTAAFVCGLNGKALDMLKSFNAEAVFVFEDGRVFVTEGIRESTDILSDGFTFIYDYDAE